MTRRYPIPDAYHAGLALQALLRMAGRHGVNHERRQEALKVLRAVKKKFPGVYQGESEIEDELGRKIQSSRRSLS